MNPLKTDFHLHSIFSLAGHDTPEKLCWQAFHQDYSFIAITDHAEWMQGNHGLANVHGYWQDVMQCQAMFAHMGLTVLPGIELGNPHDHPVEVAELLDQYPFAIRIASLHWLYGDNIHSPAIFSDRPATAVYTDYFLSLGQMASEADVNIIGHFDRILWQGTLLGHTFNPYQMETLIRDVMATIASQHIALELNTRLLAFNPHWHQPLTTMLRWFLEEGGQYILVNSDAHRANDIGNHFLIAQQLLQQIEYTPATVSFINEWIFAETAVVTC